MEEQYHGLKIPKPKEIPKEVFKPTCDLAVELLLKNLS